MKEQKNIDRLFQEKFKDFEVHPSDKVWKSIIETQKKEKDRKIIPFWWKLGGIAAALIILFTVGGLLLNNGGKVNSKIVNQDTIQDENNQDLETLSPENKNKSIIQQNNTNVAETNSSTTSRGEENSRQQNNFNNLTTTNTVVNSSEQGDKKQQNSNNLITSNSKGGIYSLNNKNTQNTATTNSNSNTTIAHNNSSRDKDKKFTKQTTSNSSTLNNKNAQNTATTNSNSNTSIAHNNLSQDKDNRFIKQTTGNSNTLNNKNTPKTATTNSNNNTNIAYNNSSQDKDNRFIKQTTGNSNSEKDNIATDINNNENTTIADSSENDKKKDLTIEAQKIEDLKNGEEAIAQIDLNKDSKWNVGAIAAPVYYGDLGGSGLDNQFSDNSKTGDVNLSYGVQVSYEVTPKLKVRTGVSTVDLSYSTNGVSFSTSGQGRSLSSVSFANDVETLVIADAAPRELLNSFISEPEGVIGKGSLEQRFNYIEIPMEAIYTISDKRIGFSVIGGVSTLLLNDNKVLLVSDEVTTTLGESSAVNDVSFSTNIGIGIDYKMTDKLQLNIEPSFKYQINGFDSNAVDFNPYYLGVYTGVSYKF